MEGQDWAGSHSSQVPGIPLQARTMSNPGASLLVSHWSFRQSRMKDMWLAGVFLCHFWKQV